MTLTRRRFLTISAATATAFGTQAHATSWQGRAFGADIALRLTGPRHITDPALAAARRTLREIEARFSLFDPGSDLSRLNRTGSLLAPEAHMQALLRSARQAHDLTEGLFDPTVQPLWQAAAQGLQAEAAIAAMGFHRVQIGADRITLDPGQALTLNGIAQGYATDCVAELLQSYGLTQALVNIGEYRSVGGPWRLGLADPSAGLLGHRTLQNGATATSSPAAMQVGAVGHILHPTARSQWSTVSVEATSATWADALSTALVLAPLPQIVALRQSLPDVTRVTLVDAQGDVTTL